jgi:hypothetical protein
MADEIDTVSTASESKRHIGRSLSVNGVHAIDVDLKKAQNLQDPIIDVNLKVNNPIGRLWLALKRLWKSQNTIVDFKLTIPLIVLPIAIYVCWAIWQGRGVSTPMSKLGVIHQVKMNNVETDILVVPTSDVYTLSYDSSFENSHRLAEKPVIVIGTYKQLDNIFHVEDVVAYNPSDIIPSSASSTTPSRSMWDTILRFINEFK